MGNNRGKISIIVALIGLIGTILAAIIGVKWGKENVTVLVQIEGKKVALNNEDIKEMATENERLNNEILGYEEEIESLKKQSEDLALKLGAASGELEDVPAIEYRNLGLSIDGEEKKVNKDKSSVLINGRKYYSKDFVDKLLPSDKASTEKDDMLYIGKIVKEKSNLFDRQIIDQTYYTDVSEDVKDTYGNLHSEAVIFNRGDNSITFNANREYSNLKCTLAVKEGHEGGGMIQIETEEEIVFTSEEIWNSTEPYEIDIPINQASTITIKRIGGGLNTYLMVADGVLYNEE